jgi:GDP-L-fucose synthase
MLGTCIADAWKGSRPNDAVTILDRDAVDLRRRDDVRDSVAAIAPDLIIHAAAFVHGIAAKKAHPTPYLLDNLLIDTSVISASLDYGTPEFLYIGSAAAYPENAPQPLLESALLTGSLEDANEGYGLAKLAGMRLCQYISREFGLAYRAVIPSNLYGPHDNYSATQGHLIAATIAKVREAHEQDAAAVMIWGDGQSRREFTYAQDLAEWLAAQAEEFGSWPELLNVGAGTDYPVDHFYSVAAGVVGYRGAFEHDYSKPNGTRQRLLDSSAAISLGWSPKTALEDGIAACYAAYLAQREARSGA